MKAIWLGWVPVVVLSGCAKGPQDPVAVDPGHYNVLVDNASVRVLKIDYAPGAKSVMHYHPDGIVVGLAPSKTTFTLPDGSRQESELAADSAQYMTAGDHNPEATGTTPVSALLVEFKAATPGTATLPAPREGQTMTMLAEGPRAVAYRTTTDPAFGEVDATHHFDQVVIALGPAQVELTIEGKLAKSAWSRGDVQFIGRGEKHSAKNTGGTPADYVMVAIR